MVTAWLNIEKTGRDSGSYFHGFVEVHRVHRVRKWKRALDRGEGGGLAPYNVIGTGSHLLHHTPL